jgi:1-acyl-sn-glycerol-3-phosphate acyltransferase
MIRSILGRLFAAYMLIIFVVTMLPTVLAIFIINNNVAEHKRITYIHKVFTIWMGAYMPLIFCPVRCSGTQVFASKQACVVVFNHQSLMDIPVSSPGIPLPNLTLGKHSFAKAPLFGYIYKSGSILVDRRSNRSRAESFIIMKQALAKGISIALYPEGTRNNNPRQLLPFQDGAFKLAIAAQCPIVPAIITNTNKVLPVNAQAFWAWPHSIQLHFMPAINTQGLVITDAVALKEQCYNTMQQYTQQSNSSIK